jgi:hypothetical protein
MSCKATIEKRKLKLPFARCGDSVNYTLCQVTCSNGEPSIHLHDSLLLDIQKVDSRPVLWLFYSRLQGSRGSRVRTGSVFNAPIDLEDGF